MRELRKIWYMDRIFIVIMMLILICSGLFMSHKRIRLLKETIELDHVMKEIGVVDNTVQNEVNYTLWEGEKDDYSMLAKFVSVVLIISFFVKWMIEEQGRNSEFLASLPVKKRSLAFAEIVELSGSVLVMVIFCYLDLMIRTSLIFKQESIHLPVFGQNGYMTADTIYLFGCFVYIVFQVILFMLLHTLVGRIEILPFVEILYVLFVPIMIFASTEIGLGGIHSIFDIVTEYHDRGMIPWQISSVLNTHGTSNTGFVAIILLFFICVMSFVIYLYSGKRDCSGRKLLGGGIFEYICLIVALIELHGLVTVALYDMFMGVSTLAICSIVAFAAALIVDGTIWYLIDGHLLYRKNV